MKAVSTIYPGIGKYFKTMTELANAACCSRAKAQRCLNGINGEDFTPQQKQSIAANIIVRMYTDLDRSEQIALVRAFFNHEFDEQYKRKDAI